MTSQLHKFISENNLPGRESRFILGVSGGIDSMVLLHLMKGAGYTVSVCHCNFSLRGEESDGDEQFVSDYCRTTETEFSSVRFDTKKHAGENNISIQMAARELRYQWFEKMRSELGFDYIGLAHNMNDVAETFMINLTRGTGLNGLTGIKPLNGKIVRPLLFATRKMIQDYATENNISWREDTSNSETKYIRNRIRHLILPGMEEMNPNIVESLYETANRMAGSYEIVTASVENIRRDIFRHHDNVSEVEKQSLLSLQPLHGYIFELFRDYGIFPGQVDGIIDLLSSGPGRVIYTAGYRIMSDRDLLIIAPDTDHSEQPVVIRDEKELLEYRGLFSARIIPAAGFTPVNNPAMAWFDSETVTYPLTVRRWRAGDRFYPFGTGGIKKLSDLMTDLKMPMHQKERVMVLESGEDIAWVIGIRSGNRFRVSPGSTRIIEMQATS